ncbi:hypothetical protein BDC45DRAFT_528685 [Circinella umbellata]|nr:hypothetical protein BDC45DRAFT_528685 [Circinella umbellata]
MTFPIASTRDSNIMFLVSNSRIRSSISKAVLLVLSCWITALRSMLRWARAALRSPIVGIFLIAWWITVSGICTYFC